MSTLVGWENSGRVVGVLFPGARGAHGMFVGLLHSALVFFILWDARWDGTGFRVKEQSV